MPFTISLTEAEQQFSSLIQQTSQGQEVIITRDGIPIARLLPAQVNIEKTFTEREQKLQRAKGIFAHIATSSDTFAQRKSQEIEFEDRHR